MASTLGRQSMDFAISEELTELKQRLRRFIADQIIPLEGDPRLTRHGPTEDFRRELVAPGREAGLLSPPVSREFGGVGPAHRAYAIAFVTARYTLLGTGPLN